MTADGLRIYKEDGRLKATGSVDLGYIGRFKDPQILITAGLDEIRQWNIVKDSLDRDCTDDELIAFLNRYFNAFAAKAEENRENINGDFLLHVLDDMDCYEIDFMSVDGLFIEDKLFYGNEEDIVEIYNTVRDGLKNMYPYLGTPNDGSIPKGHIESVLRSFYPMLDLDALTSNIVAELIGLNDGNISFLCSDNFNNLILHPAGGILNEDLCIKDWYNLE